MHVEVGVFAEAVGFGVVLVVQVIPPAGWCSLEEGMIRECCKEVVSSALSPPTQYFLEFGFFLLLRLVLTTEHPGQGLAIPFNTQCPPSGGR